MNYMVLTKVMNKDKEILLEVGRMHRCVDQMKKMLQSIGEYQDNLKDFITQRAEVKLQVNQISRNVEEITHFSECCK